MRVCVLTTSFPRRTGDLSGAFVASVTDELHTAGVAFDVIMPFEAGCQREQFLHGASVHRFQYWLPAVGQRLASNSGMPADLRALSGKMQLPAFMVMYFLKATRYARRADVIHAHWIFSGFVALLLGRLFARPFVVTVHGSDAALVRKSALLRRVAGAILKRAARTIVVSDKLREEMVFLGLDPSRTTVIYNGVDRRLFPPSPRVQETQRILWVGRLSVEKNLPMLIQAFLSVRGELPDATMVLVGDGDRRKEIEDLIEVHALSSNVSLVGMKTRAEVADFLKQCDVFVLPSLSEGFPLTVIEAMSVGRPVVASSVGALPDFIRHGENGYLIDPHDPDQLAETLVKLLKDNKKRREVGEAAARSVESLRWELIAQQTGRVYEEVFARTVSGTSGRL